MESYREGRDDTDGVAVIGMAARFPGAANCEAFWENLKNLVCSVGEVPANRWNAEHYYSSDREVDNKSVSKWGGFIDGVDQFDPTFFAISPREACVMDPQQRILLELAWACIEDAGYAQEALRGSRTGVFIGVMNFDYRERLTEAMGVIAGHMSTGSYGALIPNRISYHFDWHGPSMPIDTACSSSLVALHEAVHALQRGDCTQALVGGVSVLCSPTHYVSFSKTGMLSPEGLCRSFDDRANGYVRAEGAGLVLIKPLAQAVRDGDRIHGVIRGTAVNHGGKARTVTYPNPLAQADVIASAHERAGVPPDSVDYIETHGTGTPKGDPIEINGLKTAFARLAQRWGADMEAQSCGLGSLKANVGHLEPVAGIAGIIKVLLAMKHRTLPGLANFQRLNHRIDLSDSPFYIVEQTRAWPQRTNAHGRPLPRCAGVSSFGFGGVNAHAVVEEFVLPPQEMPRSLAPAGVCTMVVLSARTLERLKAAAQQLLEWLRRPPSQPFEFADLVYTLQVGRSAMEHRLALVAESTQELAQRVTAWCAGEGRPGDVCCGDARSDDALWSALGPEGRAGLVDGLMARGEYARLLALWTRGLPLNWDALHGECRPRRISLPTYPFARESHWVPMPRIGPSGSAGPVSGDRLPEAGGEAAPQLLFFEEQWVAQPLLPSARQPVQTILCLASDPGTREAFARYFSGLPRPVRTLFVADAAARRTPCPDTEWVDLDDPGSLREAFERLHARHGQIDAVFYLWPLEERRFIADCSPIFHLLQAAGSTGLVGGAILLAAQGDAAQSRCHWESWIGFERSAGNALAGTPVAAFYRCSDHMADAADLEFWACTLASELQADRLESCLYEHGLRLVCRLQSTDAQVPVQAAPQLRHGATYLITGGMGGLGGLFAQHLLGRWQATVVLIGRSPLDAARQQKLDRLSRSGGTVVYLQADVTDQREMARCMETVKQRFGTLQGVIHAAGVESWKSLQETSWQEIEQVLAPKVGGSLVLDELLRDEPLEWLCYFSSSSAIVGDFGACGYAVANRFQMAHARLGRSRDPARRTFAINWPLWRDGGMNFGDAQSTRFYLQSTGQRLLETAEGLAAFEHLCSLPASHCLVMAGEPSRIRRLLRLDGPTGIAAASPGVPVASGSAAAGLPLQQRIEQDLLAVSSQLLQLAAERLSLDRNLADFGFDSINLAAFATELTRRYGVEVLPAIFFSFPSLERLAHYFAGQHAAAMQSFFQGSQQVAAPAVLDREPSREGLRAVAGAEAAAPQEPQGDAIAVIGMSGRFAGARHVDDMWRLLAQGDSAVGGLPADREGDWAGFEERCGFMPGVSEFDAAFFGVSPREADAMDPRQRMLLQEAWKALEDAGHGPAQLAARCVGVFAGVEDGDYDRVTRPPQDEQLPITASHSGILAGRLAYFLDVGGPVLALNTACSSGLVALHQACQSLQSGECDTAIVAAANLLLTPLGHRQMAAAGMLSAHGRCCAFDERADGMVPGEAAVVLVLKRAALAQQDNDRIHAVIAATGINADGRTNGITAPNGQAQARLIESLYRRHGIHPDRIDHVIAHGTGTRLGDPVEVQALTQAFRAFTDRRSYCALTSTKPNFGHTLAASGLLSVVAMIQALRHETIPASLNLERPNPYVAWQESPFFANAQSRPWPRSASGPRIGAVSAFGMSGTNAHVVVREFMDHGPAQMAVGQSHYLFVLSARTESALHRRALDLAVLLESVAESAPPKTLLADISYTLLDRRQHFAHRWAWVATSAGEAAGVLRQTHALPPVRFEGKVPRDFRLQPAQQQSLTAALERCAAGQGAQFGDALNALADLYCKGCVPASTDVLRGGKPRLAALPAYPFLQARHWSGQARAGESAAAAPVAAASAVAPSPSCAKPQVAGGHETLLLMPIWDTSRPVDVAADTTGTAPLVVIGASAAGLREAHSMDPCAVALPSDDLGSEDAAACKLRDAGWVNHVLWQVPPAAPGSGEAVLAEQERGVLAGFRLIKALLALGYGKRPLHFSVITVRAQSIGAGDMADAAHAAVHGLVGSLAKEYPHWKVRLADLPHLDALPLERVLALPADRRGHPWVYRHGEWYRRHLAPIRANGAYQAPYRKHGVYIVIGGAGDIGCAWSEHLIRQFQARIVWVGRRQRDANIEAQLARLACLGPEPLYLCADAGCADALQSVRHEVLARHGAVHGVVHAAMVFANQELAGMTEPQLRSALRAKVDVSLRMAQVFSQDAMDFMLFFSSMISLIKNPRQAHYAAGCAFKDVFAQQLAQRVSCPVKVINWGYWAMSKNANADEVRLLTKLGMGLIAPEEGMRALDVLLGSPLRQLGAMRLVGGLEVEGMDAQDAVDVHPLNPEAGAVA